MRILVAGGSGFIGSRLVERLARAGHSIRVFDKVINPALAPITILGDVRNLDQLLAATENTEVVYHLAAEHRDDVTPPSLYDEVNVQGMRNLLQAAERNGCRHIIFTSSVAVYPLNAQTPDESFAVAPFNRYGQSKAEAEKLIREWADADASRGVTVLRLCVVFGENNRGNVYNLLRQLASGRFVMIGQGTNRKSMAYVGNAVEFLIACLQNQSGFHLFNYADKPDLSTQEIVAIARNQLGDSAGLLSRLSLPYAVALGGGCAADLLAKVLRRKLPLSSIRVRKFCAETTVSAKKVEQTGFRRPFTLEEGLCRTIAHEFASTTSAAR